MIIFAFTFNLETTEAAFTGNIELSQALQLLQQIVIADAVRKVTAEKGVQDGVD